MPDQDAQLDAQERRGAERHDVRRWSCCYLDGNRFDTESLDISASGVFLETDRQVPRGAPMVVVFDQDAGTPIYLVGRVVRQQKNPAGLGVIWVRAITSAEKAVMVQFLETVLFLGPHFKAPEMYRSNDGKIFCEFRHTPLPEDLESQPTVAPDNPEPAKKRAMQGPLTQFVWDPETTISVDFLLRANLGGTTCEVTLAQLGTARVAIQSAVAPIDRQATIEIELPIRSKGTLIPVALRCQLESIRKLENSNRCELWLRISEVSDESLPGGYEHYIKRLACANLTRVRPG